MPQVIFNAGLYSILLLLFYKSRKKNVFPFLIVAAYLFTAICCAAQYSIEPKAWHLSYWAFIYSFVVLIILLFPVVRTRVSTSSIKVNNRFVFWIIVWFYIAMAVVVIFTNTGKAIDALMSGEWLLIRTQITSGDFESYSSQIERIALNVVNHARPCLIPALFYYISAYNSKKHSNIIALVIGLSIFIPIVLISIVTAARGAFVIFAIQVITTYFLFRKQLSRSTKKILTFLSIIIIIVFVLYSISVTISRFADDANDSAFYYFGHSMLTFNYGVADTIKTFADGKFILGNYYTTFFGGSPFNMNSLGVHCESAFITLVGCMYLDFGPYGTIIFSLLLAFTTFICLSSCRRKSGTSLGAVILYLFYVTFLINGIFVYGKGYGFEILFAFLFYFLLRR